MLDESFADWTANGKMASEVAKRSQVGAWASRWEELPEKRKESVNSKAERMEKPAV